MKPKATSEVGKPGKFSESLRRRIETDPDLFAVVERWPDLPGPIREAVVRLVLAVDGG